MLFTMTTTHVPATDLGYLLHKHPARLQTFDLSFGQAHVFYPEAGPDRCTAALLLDIDLLQLVQTRHASRSGDFLLQPYVNDRPYVASSFLSVAIGEVFGTALSGRCHERPELVATPLPLQASIAVLPCSGGEALLRRLFEPLGYRVQAPQHPLNERNPVWGNSEYFTVALTGTMRLRDLLSHLYVLVPVLDDEKHYWIGEDEVTKLLIGPSGAGKSTFAQRHFRPTEVLSSDTCWALVADSDTNQSATPEAFEVLHFIAAKRLAAGRLTVIDATNVQPEARRPLLVLAREYHCLAVAIVFDLPADLCQAHNRQRADRNFGVSVIERQIQQLKRSLRSLKREGFRYIYTLSSREDVATSTIERQPLWSNRQHEHGPFDIIGDVHGCCDELERLLDTLGYAWSARPIEHPGLYPRVYRHREGRKAIFVGDLVDRGPRILETYQLVRHMVDAGSALCVPGNHEAKLVRKLRGRDVVVNHGLEQTLAEIERLPADLREAFCRHMSDFFDGLISHYVLDDGKLVVAHAGMKADLQGRASQRVREFALYGETTGETDAYGLPVRHNWAAEYRGQARVVYGHTPTPEAEWLNRTITIDTGCVFGGQLTALRYPELAWVSVPSARMYTEPIRPFMPATADPRIAQQQADECLDLDEVLGKHAIHTRLWPTIVIREDQSAAALEVMSRFASSPTR